MMAFEQPELSPRELATGFTDTNRYYVSESSVYRLLIAGRLAQPSKDLNLSGVSPHQASRALPSPDKPSIAVIDRKSARRRELSRSRDNGGRGRLTPLQFALQPV
jgi:hypothetical protein